MPWHLHLALKQLLPTGRKISFFTAVSVGGVALGVALLVIVISVMNGFGSEIRSKIVAVDGHLRIVSPEGFLNDPAAAAKWAAQQPEVAGATPSASGVILLQANNRPEFPMIRGIDPETVRHVSPIDDFLVVGSLDDLDDDSVFLSSELARSLQTRVGDMVDIYSPLLVDKLKQDEVLMPRQVRVAGVFQVGWNQIDASTVLCTLRTMQELYGLEWRVHALSVKLKPGLDADDVTAAFNQRLPEGLRAIAWIDTHRDFLFVLKLEKNLMFFLLTFIVIVAAFAIASSLLIAVVRKTREIGLLGAMGGQPRQIAACFCAQGLVIGIGGTALGFGLGFGFLAMRNEIVHFLARLTQSEAALLRFYQFADLPAGYVASDLVVIAISAVVISTLAGLLPAIRAARLKPAEALRSE